MQCMGRRSGAIKHTQQGLRLVWWCGAARVGAALLWTSCSGGDAHVLDRGNRGAGSSLILFAIFYMGLTVGGCIPLGLNFNNTQRGSVSNGTYAVLTILMALSVVPGLLIIDPQHMVRTDGTKVQLEPEGRPIWHEFKNIWLTLKRDPWILMFMPFSFGSLYYGAYQGSDFEVYFFDVRTRALDSLLIGFAQVSDIHHLWLLFGPKDLAAAPTGLHWLGHSDCICSGD